MIFHLLYRSHSKGRLASGQVDEILRTSIENNEKKDITGLLLYKEKIFIQLIEGDEERVSRLYEKILGDPRHTHAEIILTVRSDKRIFPKWSMAWINPEEITLQPESLAAIIEAAAKHGKVDRGLVRLILSQFVKDGFKSLKQSA